MYDTKKRNGGAGFLWVWWSPLGDQLVYRVLYICVDFLGDAIGRVRLESYRVTQNQLLFSLLWRLRVSTTFAHSPTYGVLATCAYYPSRAEGATHTLPKRAIALNSFEPADGFMRNVRVKFIEPTCIC